jgi:hypothetical protein
MQEIAIASKTNPVSGVSLELLHFYFHYGVNKLPTGPEEAEKLSDLIATSHQSLRGAAADRRFGPS